MPTKKKGQLGYNRIVVKSDQQLAIVELKEIVNSSREEEIILEESFVEDSRNNGFIARAIREVQGQIRTQSKAKLSKERTRSRTAAREEGNLRRQNKKRNRNLQGMCRNSKIRERDLTKRARKRECKLTAWTTIAE